MLASDHDDSGSGTGTPFKFLTMLIVGGATQGKLFR